MLSNDGLKMLNTICPQVYVGTNSTSRRAVHKPCVIFINQIVYLFSYAELQGQLIRNKQVYFKAHCFKRKLSKKLLPSRTVNLSRNALDEIPSS